MPLPTKPVTQDLSPDRMRAVIYGVPGAGKTTFAAGWNPKKNLIIDLEGGTRFLPGENFIERPETYAAFQQLITELVAGAHDFNTVTIDTMSSLVLMADGEAGQRYGKVAAGVVEFGKGNADRDGTIVKDILRLMGTDLSVFLCCHKLDLADEDTGAKQAVPALPTGASGKPGLREFTTSRVDFQWFARKNGPVRDLVCQPNAKYDVKSRVAMPETIALDPVAVHAAVTAGCEALKKKTPAPAAA